MSQEKRTYIRFTLAQRIEHIILLLTFTILGTTGLPQKYPLNQVSQVIIKGLGGIESTRIIHHTAATIFLLMTVYHLVAAGYKVFVMRREASMLPTIKDARDAFQSLMFNLGFIRQHPKMPRYNYVEKAEYWAMLWGMVVMSITGFMLWNPIAVTGFLPGEFIPAAKTAHGGEAVLAVLAILLWHFYHVHISNFNKSMFTGRLDEHLMEEEHGMELERIRAGLVPPPPTPVERRQRMKVYAPVAAVVTIALTASIIWFITLETTAIATLPPAERQPVFVPQTPTPFPTPLPSPTPSQSQATEAVGVPVTWEGGIQDMLQQKCGSCHGTMGGFSVESYDSVMQAVQPGDPNASQLVQVQSAGGHPGQLTSEELNRVIDWIQAGAPQQ